MGEVIKFPTKEPRPDSGESESSHAAEVRHLADHPGYGYKESEEPTYIELAPHEIERARSAIRYIQDQSHARGGISIEKLEEQRAVVRDMGHIELQRALFSSSEADWNRKPAYYLAVAERFLHNGGW